MLSASYLLPDHLREHHEEKTGRISDWSGSPFHELKWTLFLHGAFGRGRNWQTIARKWVQKEEGDVGAILLDLPWHGHSQPLQASTTEAQDKDTPTLDLAARLIHDAIDDLNGKGWQVNHLVAHSLGGKIALKMQRHFRGDAPATIIVDSTPEKLELEGAASEAWRTLQIMKALPEVFENRKAFTDQLAAQGVHPSVALWLAQNLEQADGGLRFGLPLSSLESLFHDFYFTDCWQLLEDTSEPVHFLRASRGSVISDDAYGVLNALSQKHANISLQALEGGHWLHVDNPEGILAAMDHVFNTSKY